MTASTSKGDIRPLGGLQRFEGLLEWQQKRSLKSKVCFLVLFALFVIVFTASICLGALPISLSQTLGIILSKAGIETSITWTAAQESVLLYIRLPRVLFGFFTGATLALCGAAIQGVFRNPLAEPGLIGTSGGAAMAAVLAIVFGSAITAEIFQAFSYLIIPAAAFLGSLIATVLVYRLSSYQGRVDMATMLLAGVAINSLAFAVMGLAMFLADDSQLRSITFWSLGSLAGATWKGILISLPFMAIALVVLPCLARRLDVLAIGEAEAWHLGIDANKTRYMIIIFVALAVGASIAFTGMIGFVGLVVPHLLRLVIGPAHRLLLLSSALLGGILLTSADLLARVVAEPAELPLGVVTALIGAPYFLWLLIQSKKRGAFLS